jgi:hypothetical protein
MRSCVQECQALAKRLWWHLDGCGSTSDSVDASACVERIQAVLRRAQHCADGKRAARDAKKPFAPDWTSLAKEDPAQADVEKHMVWSCTPLSRALQHMCAVQVCTQSQDV